MGDIDKREAALAARTYEDVSDPTSGGGKSTYGTGDAATDLAYQLLEGAKTAEDVAAAMRFAPGYVRAIVLVAQKQLGNDIVDKAMYLSKTADTTANVKDRDLLSTGAVNATDTTAPAANEPLPFTDGGWNAVLINKTLGQYDRINGTDSDGARCAFATALAAHVFNGPGDVVSFALNYVDEVKAALKGKGKAITPRQVAAGSVVNRTTGAIGSKSATYSDLSWLQEALHDLVIEKDDVGAPNAGFAFQESDLKKGTAEAVAHTSTTAADLIAQGNTLQPGEQFIASWIAPARGEEGQAKHQILIVNEEGTKYLYDAERQKDGAHLRPLDAANLKRYFATEDHWVTLEFKLFVKPAASTPVR